MNGLDKLADWGSEPAIISGSKPCDMTSSSRRGHDNVARLGDFFGGQVIARNHRVIRGVNTQMRHANLVDVAVTASLKKVYVVLASVYGAEKIVTNVFIIIHCILKSEQGCSDPIVEPANFNISFRIYLLHTDSLVCLECVPAVLEHREESVGQYRAIYVFI